MADLFARALTWLRAHLVPILITCAAALGAALLWPKALGHSSAAPSWTSALPPLVAVLIAVVWRRLLLALGLAVALGALIRVGFAHPLEAARHAAVTYLWGSTFEAFNLYIIAFTISLVGMVHIILRAGGMAGLLIALKRWTRGARSTRLTCVLLGGALFFDDYANTIVVGSTMRPVSDSHRISREKLAYLVDSTSAPIAGLALISTWIGYEVGLFDDLSRTLELGQSGYAIFLNALPMRFYCLFTLAFVLMNAYSGRDFGPMRRAEQRAFSTGELLARDATLLKQSGAEAIEPKPGAPQRWLNAALPVGAVILSVVVGMLWSGWRGPEGEQLAALHRLSAESPRQLLALLGSLDRAQAWREAFGQADNAKVLCASALIGSATAALLARAQGILTLRESVSVWLKAIPAMALACAILVLAWSIRTVCDDLGTSAYLLSVISGMVSVTLLPLITFLLSGAIAFATGTSWGTMGIVLPTIIPMAHAMSLTPQAEGRGEVLLLLCFAAVLDGAIFGDHCSPISDTTVMSSLSSECDHIAHVRTQAPYALVTMSAAALIGYFGVALGLPVWAALLAGPVALAIGLLAAGRRSDSIGAAPQSGDL